jgi:hypothetical protein
MIPSPKACRKIHALHALMMGSSSDREAETARTKLLKQLTNEGCTWHDLADILKAANEDIKAEDARRGASGASTTSAPSAAPTGPDPDLNDLNPNPIDLLARLSEDYLHLTPEQRIANALWILHTYVYEKFMITPRLAFVSPTHGCGKTTALKFNELLCSNPYYSDDLTAAVIYHQIDHYPRTTFLLDEADNLGILYSDNVLRKVINSGHRQGGSIDRFVRARPRKYPTFAPLSTGSNGLLPLPFMSRSIVLNMTRPGRNEIPLKLLNTADPSLQRLFALIKERLQRWAMTCSLAPEPEIPANLRTADNWRVLLSIADSLGRGAEARAAIGVLEKERPDEDYRVTLLQNIQTVFLTSGIDRISSERLVVKLLSDFPQSLWNEWRGLKDDHSARRLKQTDVSLLLRPFGIRPKNMRIGDRIVRGYFRNDFEEVWHAYCSEDESSTTTRPSLRLVGDNDKER